MRDSSDAITALTDVLRAGSVVVLSGAGVSTESGIPDYRDELGRWKQPQPMQFREFVSSPRARQRYWARSFNGWGRIAQALPNRAHRALARAERLGLLDLLITQNVDGLHSAAGNQRIVDLHGRLDRVVCLGCGWLEARAELQARLAAQNQGYTAAESEMRADGDAELDPARYERFEVVGCRRCGGVLKPDVVFFGERVPPERVARAMAALEPARALLVVGSSLMVFSGFRFARAAHKLRVPIVVANRGLTRADEMAALRLHGAVGDLLETALEAF